MRAYSLSPQLLCEASPEKSTTPEPIKRATMHSANKAFERYFRVETDEARETYKLARGGQPVANQNSLSQTDNLLKFMPRVPRGSDQVNLLLYQNIRPKSTCFQALEHRFWGHN